MNTSTLFFSLLICPSLCAMVQTAQLDYAKTNQKVSLATADNATFTVDTEFAQSCKTLKNCMANSASSSENEVIPLVLESRELMLFLPIYRSEKPNYTVLQDYSFDDLLTVLRVVQYLEIPKSETANILKKVALRLTRDDFIHGRGQAVQPKLPLYKRELFWVWNSLFLLLGACNYWDYVREGGRGVPAISDYYKPLFLMILLNVCAIRLDAWATKDSYRSRIENKEVQAVGDGLLTVTYFDNENIAKLAHGMFNDSIKCDLLVPCIAPNIRLCRLLKGQSAVLPLNEFDIHEWSSHVSVGPGPHAPNTSNIERIRKDAKEMSILLTQELSASCMQELITRLSQPPVEQPQEQEE